MKTVDESEGGEQKKKAGKKGSQKPDANHSDGD